MQATFSDAISAAEDELTSEIATFPNHLPEAQPFRARAFSETRVFKPGGASPAPASRHVIVRSRVKGDVLGTVRIMLSNEEQGLTGFQMQRLCEPWVLASLPRASTGEVSRLRLTRDRTGMSPGATALLRLCLFRGLVEVSTDLGLTHWCAVMESALLKLLRATGIHFSPVGPPLQYHGTRQSAVCRIDSMLSRLKSEQRYLWEYITANGAVWPKSRLEHRVLH